MLNKYNNIIYNDILGGWFYWECLYIIIRWIYPPSNSHKWRFTGVSYEKYNNPGGDDCILIGGVDPEYIYIIIWLYTPLKMKNLNLKIPLNWKGKSPKQNHLHDFGFKMLVFQSRISGW